MSINFETNFLVVDDDSQVRDIIVQYLRSFGFNNIIEAKDGGTAMKFVRNPSQVIDFIISDWEMPKVDGLTLLRAVRKESFRKDTKFLMVTSQGSHERMKITKAAKAHVDAYLVKPFRSDVLKEKIFTLLGDGIDPSAAEFNSQLYGDVMIQQGNGANGGDVQLFKGEPAAKGKVYIGGAFDQNNPPEYFDVTLLDPPTVNRLANCYKKVKKYDLAIELCTQALERAPDDADILFNLGYCLFLKEKYEEASKYLTFLVQLKPYHVEARSLLSEIQRVLQSAA